MVTYRTYFHLTAPVIDFDDAKNYLSEDDMTVYLNQDSRRPSSLQGAINHIEWILRDEQSGYIELEATRELDSQELEWISDWVSGQNSDGLGEGFEQQDFAYYDVSEYNNGSRYSYYDDDDYEEDEEDWVMASFDWQSNAYKFELVSST